MGKKHKPRSGSIAFYPRKRAKSEKPTFTTVKKDPGEVKPLNYYGYKAGMTHALAINTHKKSPSGGQEVSFGVTIIETPPMKVLGARYYKRTPRGFKVLAEKKMEKPDKEIARVLILGEKQKEQKAKEKSGPKELEKMGFDDIIKNWLERGRIDDVRMLVHTQPKLTGIGKKKPEIAEVFLSGQPEEQVKYVDENIGKEFNVSNVFDEKDFLDIKGVTKGKGFQGPVKRFGIKIQRPKAKKHRVVGSISPWHPATVAWTVARAGQMGYHTRTESNKKLILISDAETVNPKGGFKNYGIVKNSCIVVKGSVPGPAKRLIALRKGIRNAPKERIIEEGVRLVAR